MLPSERVRPPVLAVIGQARLGGVLQFEAFDQGVLARLIRLDQLQFRLGICGRLDKGVGRLVRVVIQAA